MKDMIIYQMSFFISCIPFVYAIFFSLTPKIRSFWFAGLSLAALMATFEIKLVYEKAFGLNLFATLIFFLFYYLTIFIFVKEPWTVVLKLVLFMIASAMISDLLCAFLFYLSGNDSADVTSSNTRLLSAFSLAVLAMAANLIWQKINRITISTKLVLFFGVFLTQLFVSVLFIFYIISKNNAPIKSTSVILFNGIAWIITDIFFIKAIFDNHRKAQLQMSLDQAMEMEKMQCEYYEDLTDSINSLRKYRHDLNNMLQTLSLIIKNPDTLENGQELFDQLCERYEDTQLPYYCSNPVVNAVILAKSGIAERKGIFLDASVNLENTGMFANIDLCSIFSNLLDNALEAADEVSDGEITLTSWNDTGYLFIKCVNSYNGKVRKNGKGFVSTKSKERGLGLSIIESIAKKYDGRLIIECGDRFSVLVTLKIVEN